MRIVSEGIGKTTSIMSDDGVDMAQVACITDIAIKIDPTALNKATITTVMPSLDINIKELEVVYDIESMSEKDLMKLKKRIDTALGIKL